MAAILSRPQCDDSDEDNEDVLVVLVEEVLVKCIQGL